MCRSLYFAMVEIDVCMVEFVDKVGEDIYTI
jgi:hypothetical protein